uniref:Zinc knuckle CX2CX4HX4C n=1 Tax=Tanacetum cinerariifolium TaxID=118510 RepID=A0A6L2LF84_TANCI|nr:hypothetical protein [Tanacetum cinerariifolium]
MDQVIEREDELSLIATQVGKPVMMDAFTSSMCVDSWGRIIFARALIEIHANSELKKEVRMAIPIDDDDDGTGYTSEVMRVEYEWTSPHYLECKIFGHNFEKCPKQDVGKTHMDGDAQNPKSVKEEAVKEKEQDNLWSKFKAANEVFF